MKTPLYFSEIDCEKDKNNFFEIDLDTNKEVKSEFLTFDTD